MPLPIPDWCFTNCDTVELFLNDKSLGEKKLDREKSLHVEWSVPYQPETITLRADSAGVESAGTTLKTVLQP